MPRILNVKYKNKEYEERKELFVLGVRTLCTGDKA